MKQKKRSPAPIAFVLVMALLFSLFSPVAVYADPGSYTPKDAGPLLDSVQTTVKLNGAEISTGTQSAIIRPTDEIEIEFSFRIPVKGDDLPGIVDEDDSSTYVVGNDTAVFDLPVDLKLKEGLTSAALKTSDNKTVGKVDFVTSGTTPQAIITFDPYLDTEGIHSVTGKFSAKMKFDLDNVGDEETLVVKILEKEFHFSVPPKTIGINGNKTGEADVTNGEVNWKVEINAYYDKRGTDTPSTSPASLKGYVFTDVLSGSSINVGEFVEGSLKIGTTDVSSSALSFNPPGLTTNPALSFEFPDGYEGTQYLFFKTKIPPRLLIEDGTQKIDNTATIATNGSIVFNKKGTASFKMTWITKAGVVVYQYSSPGAIYDTHDRLLKWTIVANQSFASLSGAAIVDALPAGLEWVSSTAIYGKATIGNGIDWIEPAVSIDPSITSTGAIPNQKETLTFSGGDFGTKLASGHAVKLEILTKVTSTAPAMGITNYNNKATLKWDQNTSGYTAQSGNVGVGINPISKSGNDSDYDYSNHTMKWTVKVDTKNQPYGGELRVLDLLVYGPPGEFTTGSAFDISGTGTSASALSITDIKQLTPRYNQKYVEGSFTGTGLKVTVYTLTSGGNAVADVLVVTNSESEGLDHTKSHTFTFKTLVTNPDIYASNASSLIYNRATLFSSGSAINYGEDSARINSDMLKKDMMTVDDAIAFTSTKAISLVNKAKATSSGAFNYQEKSIIFKIHVNNNNLKNLANDVATSLGAIVSMGSIEVKEQLPAGWEFKKLHGQDFLIYEKNDASPPQAVSEVTTYNSILSPVPTPAAMTATEGESMTFNFVNITKPYVILVKAGPTAEKSKEYFSDNAVHIEENTVTMSNENYTSATVVKPEFKIESKILNKGRELILAAGESSGKLMWTIDFKPYELALGTMSGLTIEDKLPVGIDPQMNSIGQLITTGSITVEKLELNSDGTYVTAGTVSLEGIVSYDKNTRVLKFVLPPDSANGQAYRLTYITDITGDQGQTLTNSVTLMGLQTSNVNTEGQWIISEKDASATLKYGGSITITKKGTAGTNLPGAEFTLFANDRVTPVKVGATTTGGILRIKAIPEGTYYLQETNPPLGYDRDYTFYKVEVTVNSGVVSTVITPNSGSVANALTVQNSVVGSFGQLKIGKLIAGSDADPNKYFNFIVRLVKSGVPANTEYPYAVGGVPRGTIKSGDPLALKSGEIATISNLPVGLVYTVEEDNYTTEGYVASISGTTTGAITSGPVAEVAFTNTKNLPGELTILKAVTGSPEAGKAFTFTVELSDKRHHAYTIASGGSIVSNGSIINGHGVIQLEHGESATITGLLEHSTYKVTENDYSSEGYITVPEGASGAIVSAVNRSVQGSIPTDAGRLVKFTNIKPGKLEISKTVGGNAADTGKKFQFEVELSDTVNAYTYTGSTSGSIVSGKATIWLGHDDSVIIEKLPKDTLFTVTETDYSGERYRTTVKLDGGAEVSSLSAGGIITVDTTHSAVFSNTRSSSGGGGETPTKPGITTEPGITTNPGITTEPGVTTPEAVVYGSVRIFKVDGADTAQTLAGAVFQLFDENGVLLRTSSPTGSNGVVSFGNLETGVKYYLKELTAPDGYQPSGSTYYFVLSKGAGNSDVSVTYRNAKQGETNIISIDPEDIPEGFIIIEDEIPAGPADLDDTPKTGGSPITINSLVLLMLLSGIGLLLSRVLRRRKTQS